MRNYSGLTLHIQYEKPAVRRVFVLVELPVSLLPEIFPSIRYRNQTCSISQVGFQHRQQFTVIDGFTDEINASGLR
jgi:hypothetical protein